MKDLVEKFKKYRLKQPIKEFERKAKKARRKGIWTVEELDLAEAEAKELIKAIWK